MVSFIKKLFNSKEFGFIWDKESTEMFTKSYYQSVINSTRGEE